MKSKLTISFEFERVGRIRRWYFGENSGFDLIVSRSLLYFFFSHSAADLSSALNARRRPFVIKHEKGENSMKYKLRFWTMCSIGVILFLVFAGTSAPAQDKPDAGDTKEAFEGASNEARESLETLNAAMKDPEKSIPRSLLQKAEAIAIFTNVKKGGLIVGGTGGDGVILRRTGNTWSAPVFYNIGGADVGFQIGATNTDFIMLFMTPGALKDLMDDNLELGAGVSAVAGPVGAKAAANTNLTGNEAILTYSNTEGLFAGATIGGATITADNSRNQALYKMNGGQVLTNPKSVATSKLPAELRNLTAAVTKYAK